MTNLPIDLIPLPGGPITLRDARRGTTRDVALRPFEIARTPITTTEFADAVAGDQRPATSVTWFAAIRWCNAASEAAGLQPAYDLDGDEVTWRVEADGFRLPTEAEWEFACRAGSSAATYGPLAEVAWSRDDGVDGPQPVGRKRANEFGLHDTLGNVWEWCWDHLDAERYAGYRTFRGGGWSDPPWNVRASVRRGSAPDAVLEDVGFRVARGAVGEPGAGEAQGWSAAEDARRAAVSGPVPFGWTPGR